MDYGPRVLKFKINTRELYCRPLYVYFSCYAIIFKSDETGKNLAMLGLRRSKNLAGAQSNCIKP